MPVFSLPNNGSFFGCYSWRNLSALFHIHSSQLHWVHRCSKSNMGAPLQLIFGLVSVLVVTLGKELSVLDDPVPANPDILQKAAKRHDSSKTRPFIFTKYSTSWVSLIMLVVINMDAFTFQASSSGLVGQPALASRTYRRYQPTSCMKSNHQRTRRQDLKRDFSSCTGLPPLQLQLAPLPVLSQLTAHATLPLLLELKRARVPSWPARGKGEVLSSTRRPQFNPSTWKLVKWLTYLRSSQQQGWVYSLFYTICI